MERQHKPASGRLSPIAVVFSQHSSAFAMLVGNVFGDVADVIASSLPMQGDGEDMTVL